MNVSIGGSQHRCGTLLDHEAQAAEGSAGVAVDATLAAAAGVAGSTTKVAPQAESAETAILRAVRGTLDRDCGIAAVLRASPENGHQSRQARRDRPPGAVAKTWSPGSPTRTLSPIAAWIALRGGFKG
jgi:hypothetical protein